LALLSLACRPAPSEPPESTPPGSEPVASGSLEQSDGRIGPDPEGPPKPDTSAVGWGPLAKFSGDPIEQKVEQDGLVITDHALGSGHEAADGDVIRFHYVGLLLGGREFDSSHAREPFSIEIGAGRIIPGLDRGLVGARVGMLRVLTIPPALAYGERGVGTTVPPHATLVFYIEVLSIEPKPAPASDSPSADASPSR
jgi:hypothetical protein